MEPSTTDSRYMKAVRLIKEGNIPEIERMIEKGANLETVIDPHGAKCVHIAAGHPNAHCGTQILRKLIVAGASVNSVTNDR